MNAATNSWDKKSKNYGKFNGKLNEFQIGFFNILDKFGVEFKNKTLIDIGCGTGLYSLYLAGICSYVTAVDGSAGMLNELNKSAKEYDIQNIKTLHCSFNELAIEDEFDISFLTMSPALVLKRDFEKFIKLAKVRVYMNWNKPRISTMLTPFSDKFKKSSWNNTASLFKSYLEINKIPFKTEILKERREIKRNFNDAYENLLWHLDIGGIKYDKEETRDLLFLQCKDGFVKDIVDSEMRILVF